MRRIIMALIIITMANSAIAADISTVLSPNFSKTKKKISVINHLRNYGAYELYDLVMLQQAFTKRGYVVVDRLNIKETLSELNLGTSGLTTSTTSKDTDDKSDKLNPKDDMSIQSLNRLGKLLNIDYICYVANFRDSQRSTYFKIIDVESGEVVATSVSTISKNVKNILEIMTRSLDFAQELFDQKIKRQVNIEIYESADQVFNDTKFASKVIGEILIDGDKYKAVNVTGSLE